MKGIHLLEIIHWSESKGSALSQVMVNHISSTNRLGKSISMKLISLWLFLFVAVIGRPQTFTVNGSVLNAVSGYGVANQTIYLFSTDFRDTLRTETDTLGQFMQNVNYNGDSAVVSVETIDPCSSTFLSDIVYSTQKNINVVFYVCSDDTIQENNCQASFSYNLNGNTVYFSDKSSGGINQWAWNFGDGSTSSSQNPTHTYQVPGSYAVSLYASGENCGNTYARIVTIPSDATDSINVPDTQECSALFYYDMDTMSNNILSGPVSFYDYSVGAITRWHWNFGDGDTSSVQNPVHAYNSTGLYSVTLSIFGDSCESTYSTIVRLLNNYDSITPPQECSARFYYTYDSVLEASSTVTPTVYFYDVSMGSNYVRYWDFGDGNSSGATNPVYTYDSIGTYTVTLRISGDNCESSYSLNVVLTGDDTPEDSVVCSASFAYYEADSMAAELLTTKIPVYFYGSSAGDIDKWHWDFGDGDTSNVQNPVHLYESSGTYYATLSVFGVNCETSYSSSVILTGDDTPEDSVLCSAYFLYYLDSTVLYIDSEEPFTYYFYDKSEGTPSQWNWDFGDGSISSEQNPVHTYDSVGVYAVSLNISGDSCESSYFTEVNVPEPSTYENKNALSVDNNKNQVSLLKVYPNPVNDDAVLDFYSEKEQTITVNILNVKGNKLDAIYRNATVGLNSLKINMNQLNKGVYVIQVVTGNDIRSVNVVKN